MNKNKPAIRFKGFSDAWEQRKLASLCDKFTDGDWIEAKDQSDDGVRLIQTGNVGVAEFLDKSNNKKWISTETFVRLKCEEVLPGDILISRLPEPAGRACIMPLLSTKMITAVDCTIARTSRDIYNKFLLQYLSSQTYFDEVNTCLAGGTRQRISRGNLANFDVFVPSKYDEQKRIGDLLSKVDNLITLHQRECEFLYSSQYRKNIKKYAYFTTAWEQRELGDIAVKVTEKNTQNIVSETFTNSAEYGVISQRDFFDHDVSNAEKIDGYYIIRNDDFVYNPRISTSAPCGPINRNKMGRKGVMSPLYTVFRVQNVSHLFLEWYFKTSHWHPYMYFNGDSGARADRFSIKNDLFFKMPIPLPTEEEQCKIGATLERVNNLITLHQREPPRITQGG